MPCSNQAHGHNHDHGHDHHHNHDGHDHDIPLGSGPQDSLYGQVDLPNVVALNAVGGAEAGQKVIKWVYMSMGRVEPQCRMSGRARGRRGN